jgi:Multidrug resistance efflux pump
MKRGLLAATLAGATQLVALAPAAAEDVELTTRVSGVVESVLVEPGQRVAKGSVLLRLDDTVLRARLDEATAEAARAQADADDAGREQGRAQELFDRTVSSSSELEAAALRLARAQAALAAAQARLAIARRNLADAELRAPFDGVVKSVPGAPGSVVAADCQPRTLVVLDRTRR